MNARTEFQVIVGQDGHARIGITQAAYAQMERVKRPRRATVEKIAAAPGLDAEQLGW